MEKPELVGDLAERAMKLAQTPEQKAAIASEALLVYLRTNNIPKARAIQNEVFDKNPPKENQLYVRAASALLLPADPGRGVSSWTARLQICVRIKTQKDSIDWGECLSKWLKSHTSISRIRLNG